MLIDLLLVPFGTTYRALREAAVAAEEAGFNGVWTWDHLRVAPPDPPGSVPEAMTVLTALAEATSRVQLGPLVLNVANRHPGVLANMAATLQEVSGGRLVLGIGAGGGAESPFAAEQRAIGRALEPDRVRAERVAETAQVLKLLWGGGEPSFDGQHYQLDHASGYLVPNPPPKLVVAGFGPRLARIAGRYADGFNTQARHPRLPELIATAREACAASGRDPAAFEVSVFAGLSEGWLSPSGPDRTRVEALGVTRVILLVRPPYPVAQIRAARGQ